MSRSTRHLIAALIVLQAPIVANPALAQEYPAKLVRIIVPFPAGGATDVMARMFGQRLSEQYGQNFVVDNRPGATGTIAGAAVAKSAPDGYMLMLHSSSSYVSGYLYRKLSYDPVRAFAPVIRGMISPLWLVSAATLPVKNVKELVALAKRRPNELTFATVGRGSAGHMAAEMFNTAAGIKAIPVHYKGAAPSLVALAGGETGYTVLNLLDPAPFVKQGKLRSMAVTSAKRSPAMPDVPTMLESGINIEASLWQGLFSTAGTPAPVINKLNADIGRYLAEPQTNAWLLTNMGGEFAPHTPQQYAEFLVSDTARWQAIIKQMDLQLD